MTSPSADVEIRRIRADEIDEAGRMWQRSMRDAYSWLRAEQLHPLEEALRFFRDAICVRCDVWVATAGARVVGVMALEGDVLQHLFIDPDHQRRGIGGRLLDVAMDLSPRHLSLVTLQRNTRARRFYEKRGFVATRTGTSPPPESEPDVWYAWNRRLR